MRFIASKQFSNGSKIGVSLHERKGILRLSFLNFRNSNYCNLYFKRAEILSDFLKHVLSNEKITKEYATDLFCSNNGNGTFTFQQKVYVSDPIDPLLYETIIKTDLTLNDRDIKDLIKFLTKHLKLTKKELKYINKKCDILTEKYYL
jgi:hypothetical protein